MPTLEILEAEMFWAQYDRPPPTTDDGGEFPAPSYRVLDTSAHDNTFFLGRDETVPSPADSVVPQRAIGVFARWSRYLLGLRRPRRLACLAASAGAGRSTRL